jgi:hypothetical protein
MTDDFTARLAYAEGRLEQYQAAEREMRRYLPDAPEMIDAPAWLANLAGPMLLCNGSVCNHIGRAPIQPGFIEMGRQLLCLDCHAAFWARLSQVVGDWTCHRCRCPHPDARPVPVVAGFWAVTVWLCPECLADPEASG